MAFADTVSHCVVGTEAADTARPARAARSAPGQIAALVLLADSGWVPANERTPALPVDGSNAVGHRAVTEAAAGVRDGDAVVLIRG